MDREKQQVTGLMSLYKRIAVEKLGVDSKCQILLKKDRTLSRAMIVHAMKTYGKY